MKITKSQLAEMKDLVDSEDTNLDQIRNKFQLATGSATTLTDEQLTAATYTDDDDDDLLIKNIMDIQAHGLEITEDEEESEDETVG